jgi:hypothetical protein
MTDKYEYNAEELANRLHALICAVRDVEDTGRLGDDDENIRHTLLAMALNESRALVELYDGGEQ